MWQIVKILDQSKEKKNHNILQRRSQLHRKTLLSLLSDQTSPEPSQGT